MIEEIHEVICPHCQKKNKVTLTRREEDFDDVYDFHCAYCGMKLGKTSSAQPPVVEYINEEGN